MKKDKLDKTIDSFKPGKNEEIIEEKQPILNPVMTSYDKEIEQITLATKDNYLPYIIVKIGLVKNNAEARDYITKHGVILNGKLCTDTDATNESLNFSLQFGNVIYNIFKV